LICFNIELFSLEFLLLFDILLLLFAILDAIGCFVQILGSIILIMLTVPMKIINAIIITKPILLNLIAFSILLNKLKKHAAEKKITIITAMDTKIERLGNSVCENEEIVNKIRNPPIIVESSVRRVLISIFKFN
jgi:hypothetical protein